MYKKNYITPSMKIIFLKKYKMTPFFILIHDIKSPAAAFPRFETFATLTISIVSSPAGVSALTTVPTFPLLANTLLGISYNHWNHLCSYLIQEDKTMNEKPYTPIIYRLHIIC